MSYRNPFVSVSCQHCPYSGCKNCINCPYNNNNDIATMYVKEYFQSPDVHSLETVDESSTETQSSKKTKKETAEESIEIKNSAIIFVLIILFTMIIIIVAILFKAFIDKTFLFRPRTSQEDE